MSNVAYVINPRTDIIFILHWSLEIILQPYETPFFFKLIFS